MGVELGVGVPEWLASVVAEWKPRPRLGGAEWAERERILSREESPAPGPWRSVPWQREILDALAASDLDWIVILKAAQMGVSELIRCAIGRWSLLDPGDVLWVMTTEDAARKAMRKLQAMFRATPTLQPMLSDRRSDTTLLELSLTTGMRIVIGWAGSAQSLASDPFRYVILDEVGKYKWSVQGEASPVDLAKERTKVFGRRAKIVLLSSPKDESDLIVTSHREVLDRRTFAVPCSCGEISPVEWSFVRWPGGEPTTAPSERDERARLADSVERGQSAWVECRGCRGRVLPHVAQNDQGARWVAEEGATTGGRRRAYHVPEFFHWETTISGLVAKFLRCMTPSSTQGFFNGSLGLPYRAELATLTPAIFELRATHPPRLVPSWATTIVATADTQLRGWWFMVRAWGPGGRSRLLDWGWAETEADLLARCVNARFDVEGAPEVEARPIVFAVDTGGGMAQADGSRTKQTYRLVKKTRVAHAIKGEGNREAIHGPPWRPSKVRFSDDNFGEAELDLYLVNRNFYADELARLIRAEDPLLWEECRGAEDRRYTRQMSSEEKVLITTASGTQATWRKKSGHVENHLYDCARYQVWAAEFCRVDERKVATWDPRRRPVRRTDATERDAWVIGRGEDR
jgi:phage terminase large subunit GpA-like protein